MWMRFEFSGEDNVINERQIWIEFSNKLRINILEYSFFEKSILICPTKSIIRNKVRNMSHSCNQLFNEKLISNSVVLDPN